MFRFGSLALAGVAALSCTLATPNVSRAEFGFDIGLGRTHFGIGPRVIVAPAPVFYPTPAPGVVDPASAPVVPWPVVVVPAYRPWPVEFGGRAVYPHYEHHRHHPW